MLGALVILVLSIAGMNIYRRRTDVLTGPYISNRDPPTDHSRKRNGQASPGESEKETHDASLSAGLELGSLRGILQTGRPS